MTQHLPPGNDPPGTINVVVEIPKGSQNKYEFDHETGVLTLDRVLFSPLHYPGDYGYVPSTLAEDGDPLDALVMVTYPTYPGTLIQARPLGMLEMIDGGKPDDKILCVPTRDIRFANVATIDDVEEPILNEIAHFFEVYKHLEGKKVDVVGWKSLSESQRVITKAIGAYDS